MSKLRAFTMPKWGIEMKEGLIAEWMIKEGERFSKGQVIALVETDKITNELEAEEDAVFLKLTADAGETYPVGALLGVLSSDGSEDSAAVSAFVSGFKPAGEAGERAEASGSASPANSPASSQAAASKVEIVIPDGVLISPQAALLAKADGIDVTSIEGSGRNGRITYQDVQQANRPQTNHSFNGAVDIQPKGHVFDHIPATPLAKRLAVTHGVDLATLSDRSGSRGRISKADVLKAAGVSDDTLRSPTAMQSGDVKIVKMSPMRKAIARSLSQSKATIPHFYLRGGVCMDAVQAERAKAKAGSGDVPSVNDYIIRAIALSLIEHPDVNVQVHGDEIHHFPTADIAMAVATDKGLITPIIRSAERLSVGEIAKETRAIAARAREGRLQAEEFQGGSFSISNLGMFGVEQFDAIINPPQGAILAVGGAKKTPIEKDFSLAFATMAQFSLSFDHRAIDGAVGAKFFATLKEMVEDPEKLI